LAAWLALSVALILGANAAIAFDKSVPPSQRNAILICWDGAQRNHVNECLKNKELPNLAALAQEGKMVEIDVVGHKTDTKAGHAQMLTGYDPEATGVFSNAQYKPIPLGYTIFEDLQKQFGKDKIATIMLTGKDHHIGSCGPRQAIQPAKKAGKNTVAEDEETAKLKPRQRARAVAKQVATTNKEGEPWYLVKASFTVWDGDIARPASEVGPKCLEYIDKYGKGRLFAFFHFCDPDHEGHRSGENSKEYNDALIECDQWLGKIVEELKKEKLYDKTVVMVTADHGFDEGLKAHKDAPYVVLATNDPKITRKGDQRDIVPTILVEMGADPSKVDPKLPGKPLTSD
jgi:predicted AlkP superfamily pyrophosphatase or phosphodiesterase